MARGLASFSILGVNIKLDASWILLALLIAWSLASGTFPALHQGLTTSSYWGMAAATVAGVAVSIILHELGHTLVARSFGLPVKSITLFVFGGIAEMEHEPKAPMAELVMAAAGPLVSVALGTAFWALAGLLAASPAEVHGVLHYLGVLNFTLAAFNMAPAFPLDGGRIFRALIWMVTGDALKATRIAARSGEVLAIMMMGLGALSALTGSLTGGLWWIILGWFIYALARAHRAEAESRQLLSGARVADLMTRNPVTAPADMSVNDFVETVLRSTPYDLIPIMAGDALIGAAGFKNIKDSTHETWTKLRLRDIATPMAELVTADQNEPIEAALDRMQKARASRIIVLDRNRLVGMLTLSDLAAHLRFRAELASAKPVASGANI
jgi:Zn-dependent protease/CBS domain-containing protein